MIQSVHIEIYIPTSDSFTLGISRLGGPDLLGLTLDLIGRWVPLEAESGNVEIKQGYIDHNPFSGYETGTCDIDLINLRYAPTLNDKIVPGVPVRVFVSDPDGVGQFEDDFTTNFASAYSTGDVRFLFKGYILDAVESHTKDPNAAVDDYQGFVRISAVDVWHKLVTMPDILWTGNMNTRVNDACDDLGIAYEALSINQTPLLDWYTGLDGLYASTHSVMGSAWVDEDVIKYGDSQVWAETDPVVTITNVHEGTHLCYIDFEQGTSLRDVTNQIRVQAVESVFNVDTYEESAVETITNSPTSQALYGTFEQTIVVNIEDWDADAIINKAKFPSALVSAVEVEITDASIVPKIHDYVTFHYSADQIRRVSRVDWYLTPRLTTANIEFFSWVP